MNKNKELTDRMKRLKGRHVLRSIQRPTNIMLYMACIGIWMSSCLSPGEENVDSDQLGTKVAERDSDRLQEPLGRGGPDTLTYTYDEYQLASQWAHSDTLNDVHQVPSSSEITHYTAKYPLFSEQDVKSFVQRALLGNDTSDVVQTAHRFIDEYEAFQDSFPMPRTWTSETESEVIHLSTNYLGLKTHHYSYTGGAHGIYWIMFAHYWLHDQQDLFLDNIIQPMHMEEFLQVAEDFFWAQERINQPDMEPEGYFFEDMKFHVPDNFLFEQDSLMFLYNIYEIKPYVYGHTEWRVPYSAIEGYLTDRAHYIIHDIQKQ